MIRHSSIVKRFSLVSGLMLSVAAALVFASLVAAKHFGAWGEPVNAELIPGTSQDLN